MKIPWRCNPLGYPETTVWNYHYSLRNDPEERSSLLLVLLFVQTLLFEASRSWISTSGFLSFFERYLIINVQYFMSEGTTRRATVSSSTEGKVNRHVTLQKLHKVHYVVQYTGLNKVLFNSKMSSNFMLYVQPTCVKAVSFTSIRKVRPILRRIPRHPQKFHRVKCRYPVRIAADSDSRRVNYGQKFIYARQ